MDLLGHFFGRNRKQPREPDAELSALLQQWQGVSDRPDFEAAVWRRIRRVPEPASPAWSIWADFGWSTAAAAFAGIVVGVWLAFAPGTPVRDTNAASPLLHRDTLAGSYVTMLAGGPP